MIKTFESYKYYKQLINNDVIGKYYLIPYNDNIKLTFAISKIIKDPDFRDRVIESLKSELNWNEQQKDTPPTGFFVGFYETDSGVAWDYYPEKFIEAHNIFKTKYKCKYDGIVNVKKLEIDASKYNL